MFAIRLAVLVLVSATCSLFVQLSTFAEEPKPTEAPLVTGGRWELNLAGAETILAAARKQADEMKLKVNIAVVDHGGHLIAFVRTDGARPASGYTAITKAVSAATFRQESGPRMVAGTETIDLHLSLSLQSAAFASGGKLTTLKGGVPIVLDGQVIGAVGVGGGTGEQDAIIAKAGIQKLLEKIAEKK